MARNSADRNFSPPRPPGRNSDVQKQAKLHVPCACQVPGLWVCVMYGNMVRDKSLSGTDFGLKHPSSAGISSGNALQRLWGCSRA